jgi:hypothetical protein
MATSKIWVTLVMVGLVSGCISLGPKKMATERFDYNTALADSWKTQALLNIVRVRYSDWPVFLDIDRIATQYTWERVGFAKGILRTPFRGGSDQFELGGTGKYKENPVVLYKPLSGRQFMKSMLTPSPPSAVLALIYTGWSADEMFRVMIHSVNGCKNTQVEAGAHYQPDRKFGRVIAVLRDYQLQNALVINVHHQKDPDSKRDVVAATVTFMPQLVDDGSRQALVKMKALLGLDAATHTFAVEWGAVPQDSKTLVMETRSVVQVMVALAATVDIPAHDSEAGNVQKLRLHPNENQSDIDPLMDIRSGPNPPEDAFASCKYRGSWFWIEDTSLNSKRTFSYLSLLLTLTDADTPAGVPLVITTN